MHRDVKVCKARLAPTGTDSLVAGLQPDNILLSTSDTGSLIPKLAGVWRIRGE